MSGHNNQFDPTSHQLPALPTNNFSNNPSYSHQLPSESPSAPLRLKISTSKWLEKQQSHPDPLPFTTGDDPDYHSDTPSSNDPSTLMATGRRSSSRLELSQDTSSRSRRGSKTSSSMAHGTDDGYASRDSQPPTRSTRQHPAPQAVEAAPAPNGSGADQSTGPALRARPSRAAAGGESDDQDAEGDLEEDEPEEEVVTKIGRGRGRNTRRVVGSEDEDEAATYVREPKVTQTLSIHGRPIKRITYPVSEDEDEEDQKPAGRLRRGANTRRKSDDFVVHDEEDEEDMGWGERKKSSRMEEKRAREENERKERERKGRAARQESQLTKRSAPKARATRNSQKADTSWDHGDEEGHESTESDTEDEIQLDDDEDDIVGAPKRRLRQKPKIDYYNIPPLEAPPQKRKPAKGKQRAGGDPFSGLPHNLTGAQWASLYPEKGGQPDSSDDDAPPNFSTPRKAALFGSNAAAAAAGFGGGAGMLAGGANLDLAGTPNNLGKVGHANTLADTDPLGVSNVSFDSVGGLGAHIQQLKEMVSLPLLYPEVFERFNITPPRGVLFHGPPGTGKTLLARALAASCSTEGQKISFFMRKGADCLSKWVGEAERQLRLLFDEAKACQPSIIFFDEIDGLAPVRSSKQEQIHASIVSTLLALMDGMDGRGQVIVIGATNRPDAIDPALRRPGRFDREFYFPLPNLEGRRKILDIHTKGWEPPIEESFKDELASLTKGYGGADLRALCTEAALNAVQRTYPQIYKTNDRLVIKPETIDVTARDFIISQKNLIPSTARATSSAAAAIPAQLEPLLSDAFEAAKRALSKVLPELKKPNILEEAEWEDDGGGFQKEKMLQAYETLRVFRPRMLICGESGMGQGYVGAAVLHHLEGFHVQTLDLATLVSDSSRTMEAACVQLFVEAKRHKPSILFIPSLVTWCSSVTETVRSTVKGLLDGLDPSDPILLLAIVDGPLTELPGDVRAWFGFVKGNRVVMGKPSSTQRHAFFADVIAGIRRPPNEFPDAMPRRKRILEILEIAPPPPPRVPTAAELQQQEESDLRLLEYLKWRLGPILNELKKRYKRFTRSFYNDWRSDDLAWRQEQQQKEEEITGLGTQPYHNVDLDTMHLDLYDGVYHTPEEFLQDILRIQVNAQINVELERDADAPVKAGQMVNHVNVMIDQTFDQQFRTDCARMAERLKASGKANVKEGKGKGKAVVQAAEDIAAAAAAGGGRRYSTRSRGGGGVVTTDEHNGPVEIPDIGELERRLKRTRKEDEDSQAEADDVHGPSKRSKAANGTNGSSHESEDGSHPDEPVASTSRLNGTSSSSGFADLLNPSANFSPPSPPDAQMLDPHPFPPELPGSSTSHDRMPGEIRAPHSIAPPMQVGPLPDVNEMEFSGPLNDVLDPSTLLPLPASFAGTGAGVASSSGSGGQVRFAPEPEVAIISTPPPTSSAGDNNGPKTPTRESSPIAVDVSTPEPEPHGDFELSDAGVESLNKFITESTEALSIDELEQLRAACYDIIWRGRKEWDRTEMLTELTELAHEFVLEVEEAKGFA